MSSRIDPASAQAEYPTPEIVACPYPFYAKLREESPLHRLENGDFLVTRWEDLVTVARRPEVFSNSIELINPGFAEAMGARAGEGRLSSWATPFTDPPDHTVKRSLLLGMFMPDQLRVYEPTIRVLADELIDALPDGRTDFRTAFADELPPGTAAAVRRPARGRDDDPGVDAEQHRAGVPLRLRAGEGSPPRSDDLGTGLL